MKTLKKLVDIACMVDMYLNFTFLVALKLAVANLKIRSSIFMYQDGYDIFVVVVTWETVLLKLVTSRWLLVR